VREVVQLGFGDAPGVAVSCSASLSRGG